MIIDRTDVAILSHLQRDGRISNRDLAEKVSLSTAPCWRRVRRLEKAGYIRGYAAVVDAKKVGLQIMAFAQISLDNHHPETIAAFDQAIQDWPEILECHSVTGPSCDYLLKIVVSDMDNYEQFLMNHLLQMRGIRSVNTLFSLKRRKATLELPVTATPDRD